MASFQLLEMLPPTQKGKKYAAKVYIPAKGIKIVNFGSSEYQQYEDKTPLQLWKHLNHYDTKRRDNYRKRHAKNTGIAAQLSLKFLW